jgi:hypothetical protein
MEGRRRQAKACGGPCRAQASRLRRILAGEAPVDGAHSAVELLGRLEARAHRETAQTRRAPSLAA